MLNKIVPHLMEHRDTADIAHPLPTTQPLPPRTQAGNKSVYLRLRIRHTPERAHLLWRTVARQVLTGPGLQLVYPLKIAALPAPPDGPVRVKTSGQQAGPEPDFLNKLIF
ncbi:hypothetical protein VY476_002126 [Salmonella enterica]|nr:hypothetical protein [Salmonella enterica]